MLDADGLTTPADSTHDGSDEPAEHSSEASPQSVTATPTIRKIEGPATEPIDMAGVAGPAMLKRLGPVVVAVLLLLLLLRRKR
jgi:hypothetical protein